MSSLWTALCMQTSLHNRRRMGVVGLVILCFSGRLLFTIAEVAVADAY